MNVKFIFTAVLCCAPAVTFANRFLCDNDNQPKKPQWAVKAYNGSDNKPSTFVLSTGKEIEKTRTIAAVTDDRRIDLQGEGQLGTYFQIKLTSEESDNLVEKGDQRLKKLADVTHVRLWVSWDSGDEMKDNQKVVGHLDFLDGNRGKAIYKHGLVCTYQKRNPGEE